MPLLTVFDLFCDSVPAFLSVLLLYCVVFHHHFHELSRKHRILQQSKQITKVMSYLTCSHMYG